jgi:hypothetical protein
MSSVYDGGPRPDVQSWLEGIITAPPDLTAPDGAPRYTQDPEVAEVLARDEAQRQAAIALAATPGATEVRDASGQVVAAVHAQPRPDGQVMISQFDYWLSGQPKSCPS